MSWINVPKAKPTQAFNRVSHAHNARNLWCALATAVQCAYAAPMLQFIPAPHASTSVANIAAKSNSILVFVDSRVPDADQLLMNIAKGEDSMMDLIIDLILFVLFVGSPATSFWGRAIDVALNDSDENDNKEN